MKLTATEHHIQQLTAKIVLAFPSFNKDLRSPKDNKRWRFREGVEVEPVVRFIAEEMAREPLSYRERQAFKLLGQGKTTREIAKEMNVSSRTVESWWGNIKRKRGFENINQLICAAVRDSCAGRE